MTQTPDYAAAERLLPWNVAERVYHSGVEPHWIAGGPRFWYRTRTRAGLRYLLVDPEQGEQRPAFDHARLAAGLSALLGEAYDPDALPLDDLTFSADLSQVTVRLGERRVRWDPVGGACVRDETPAAGPGEVLSPDGRWIAFRRDHNLWVRSSETGAERALTSDGAPDNGYACPTGVVETGLPLRRAEAGEAQVVWSPDSRRLLTHRLDERAVAELPLVQSTPHGADRRPVLYSYRCALPGDAAVPLLTLLICDVETGASRTWSGEPLPTPCLTPWEERLYWLDAAGTAVFVVRTERGFGAARLCRVDAASGEEQELLTERSSTWVDVGPVQWSAEPPVHALASGELLWWSERDGWGHLYLLDGVRGNVIRQVTAGAWLVREIAYVDEARRVLWFTASGREAGRNPYLRHLYKVSLDGGEPELLTPHAADHNITFSPCGGWYVDVFSRIDQPPVSVLRRVLDGAELPLERCDIDDLLALGWRPPQPFSVPASDGCTELFGVLVFPTNFDPARRYPLVDDVYPGPHSIRTPVRFPLPETAAGTWRAQALAELGCIVVMLDGPGTGFRSKAFHNAASGLGFGEAGGLPEHVHALRLLATERPYLDIERVGVYGHSGGGFAAARAMLLYPDFFTVGVAASGNHDQRGYHAQWGEHYLGADVSRFYHEVANGTLAERLRGKLLLIHGELDDDVHPSMTLQLVDALVRANRDFDLLLVPNADHGYHDPTLPAEQQDGVAERYVMRRRWDYFVEHLLGLRPPANYLIRPPGADAGTDPKGGLA